MMTSIRPADRCSRAFTMVESTISILIVGTMMVAALEAVAGARAAEQDMRITSRGRMFAEDLMSEIIRKPYQDPDDATLVFGREASELGSTLRSGYDDVDDYHKLEEAPPVAADGTDLESADGYRRIVSVRYARANNVQQDSLTATGIKRIHVSVYHGDRRVVELIAYRTSAWGDPLKDARGLP